MNIIRSTSEPWFDCFSHHCLSSKFLSHETKPYDISQQANFQLTFQTCLCSPALGSTSSKNSEGTYARIQGFPGGASGKEPACQCRRHKRCGSDPWSGRSPGGGHGDPFPYSCLENPVDRRAWQATHSRITELDTTKATSMHIYMCHTVQWNSSPLYIRVTSLSILLLMDIQVAFMSWLL